MRIDGRPFRTIWPGPDAGTVQVIDQAKLPHAFEVATLSTSQDVARAIRTMVIRGAPLIGVTGAYGLALALREDPSDANLHDAHRRLYDTRPTAVNLRWALEDVARLVTPLPPAQRFEAAWLRAGQLADEDVELCASIGRHGLEVFRALHAKHPHRPLNVLTHCNAGWLATVDWGTALAPVYAAHDAGLPVHVWVDETRPRNQGLLTEWELRQHGVAHTLIADNAGGHLMQHGDVDVVIVGTDRTTRSGDVCNKIGTYLKALAAYDNGVPFYVGAPSPSIDWNIRDGVHEVPIEGRAADELSVVLGRDAAGNPASVRIAGPDVPVSNPAFDVTPARLVTGLVTERGVCPATEAGLLSLFPERA